MNCFLYITLWDFGTHITKPYIFHNPKKFIIPKISYFQHNIIIKLDTISLFNQNFVIWIVNVKNLKKKLLMRQTAKYYIQKCITFAKYSQIIIKQTVMSMFSLYESNESFINYLINFELDNKEWNLSTQD